MKAKNSAIRLLRRRKRSNEENIRFLSDTVDRMKTVIFTRNEDDINIRTDRDKE